MFRKFLMIFCFLIMILSLTTVSANENNQTSILKISDNSTDEIIDVDETPKAASFDELEKDIFDASDTLVLNKDYENSGNCHSIILINKTLTVEGNGFSIKSTSSYGIFNITADDVVFSNIVFICPPTNDLNIVTSDAQKLGVFHWNGLNGLIRNCTFMHDIDRENAGTFDDLANEIETADDVLVLSKDYCYMKEYLSRQVSHIFINGTVSSFIDIRLLTPGHDEEGILINKSITIDGNGHVLDGRGLTRIFKVINGKVIFKNIIFKDGSSVQGSAIKGNALVINSTFNDNYCRNNLRYREPVSSIYGSYSPPFYYETRYGGALYGVDAINCTFRNNQADYGGAIFKGTALNCIFENNYAADYGGAICNVEVINSTFRNNRASSGGALNLNNAINCIFENNQGFKRGGAIYDADAFNCTFLNNTSPIGGAIFKGSCDWCIFINNTASYGGAIASNRHQDYIFKGDRISNSIFINNLAHDCGGAIWGIRDYAFDSIILNCTFKRNSASYGGAAYAGIIVKSAFENNSALNGSDVYNSLVSRNSSLNAYNSIFFNQTDYKTFSDLNDLINSKEDDIYLFDDYVFDLDSDFEYLDYGIFIMRDVVIHGNGHMINAKNLCRIFNVFANATFENISFINGQTSGCGGAINGKCMVLNCSFYNNYAYENGGALCDAVSFNSSFIKNLAWRGGAISCSSAYNCLFVNNSAMVEGGAIFTDSNNTYVVNSIFKDNHDIDIFSMYGSINIINSTYDSAYIHIKTPQPDLSKIISHDIKIYYMGSDKFHVTVYGSDGALVADQQVKFIIGKKVFHVKTDDKGVASLKIKQKSGKYSIVTQYNNITVKNTINVKSRLITKDICKKTKKTTFFNVKVLNANGNPYSKQTVKIKFTGKVYKLKTNSKGIAKFKISKKIKAGKYTIKTMYLGLTNKNKIIVKK